MRTRFTPLFVTTLLVLTVQQTNAEQPVMNFASQPPVWNNGQIPITWGDCIPVPIAPMPNNMPPSQMMPPAYMPAPFPAQGSVPVMVPSGPPLLPPPSPFFNTSKSPAPNTHANQPACDNGNEVRLKALQVHYNKAAAASKNKIQELTQALEDIHNQMTDAREAIETLSKEQETKKAQDNTLTQEDAENQMSDARDIIEKLSNEQESSKIEIERLKTLQNSNESNRLSLHKELETAKKNMAEQLEKMHLSNSLITEENLKAKARISRFELLQNNQESNRLSLHDELDSNKRNMTEQLENLRLSNAIVNKNNYDAKEKILRLETLQDNQESNRLSLHNELVEAKNNTAEKEKYETILRKLSTEMATLKDTSEEQNSENSMLNDLEVALSQKLARLDDSNKSLKEKLTSASNDAQQQNRKLKALSSSTQELGALRNDYKERNKETIELKKQLTNLDDANESLKTQLSFAEKNAEDHAKKLTSASNDAKQQSRKLKALSSSTQELGALRNVYKERNEEAIELKKQLIVLQKGQGNLKNKLKSLQIASSLESKQGQGIIVDLKKQLASFNDANKSLKIQLSSAEKNVGDQAKKLTTLSQSNTKLTALQGAYKEQNDENETLKKKLAEFDDANKSLRNQVSSAEKNIGDQATKLTALSQSTTELATLQKAHKEQNDENEVLKKALTEFDDANKAFKTQLSSAEKNAGDQARKLTALSQSATELAALQSAYKERNDENEVLKKTLTEFDNANKSLKTQLSSSEKNIGDQARKLTALNQSASKLTAIQSAYKARNEETVALKSKLDKLGSLQTACTLKETQDQSIIESLKKKFASLDDANKSLKTQLSSAETNAGSQARKLTALNQSASKLSALQSAYKERNDENEALKKQLTKFDSLQTASTLKGTQDQNIIKDLNKKLASLGGTNKTLKNQLSSAETNAGSQAKKLATLMNQSTSKLTALQSSYDDRNEEASELKSELTEYVDENKSLLEEIASLKNAASSQTSEIKALASTSGELTKAYKELNAKKEKLSSELIAARADTDKDGILDVSDKCPSTLEGVEVNGFGCFADIDNDGVANSKDDCPASPVNTQVNEKGCPKIRDADKDTVADESDLCPNTTAGSPVNEFGCSPTENITLEGVNFATGSARLTASSLPLVAAAAKTLKKSPNLNIEISGYTDNQGLGIINKRLSQRRANTVMIQLIKNDVDANRLTAKGYGEKNPIASNKTEKGRATNRRVELKIRK